MRWACLEMCMWFYMIIRLILAPFLQVYILSINIDSYSHHKIKWPLSASVDSGMCFIIVGRYDVIYINIKLFFLMVGAIILQIFMLTHVGSIKCVLCFSFHYCIDKAYQCIQMQFGQCLNLHNIIFQLYQEDHSSIKAPYLYSHISFIIKVYFLICLKDLFILNIFNLWIHEIT